MSVEEVTQKTQDLKVEDSKPATVLSDSKDFELKHPLNSKWTLWYTKPAVDKSESWSDLLRPVTSLETVEEFWAIQNGIPKPYDLPIKSDYHLFRNDIRPEWEDEANAEGGKWSYQFKNKRHNIDELWLRTLLAVIGETIDEEDSEINGCVLNVRKAVFKIAIWTRTTNMKSLTNIGTKFKQVLQLGEDEKLEFYNHRTSNSGHAPPTAVL
ncbi:eukaryotic translation initiation factor 4E [Kluyveromyces marxianus]|uniref:Eukaryotic translation initiation factor 4E n=2 Tax=Kluyveromyces marxianus TaxID=4911 RepID=W0TI07_KLUMD|nr:eukaryotic translation initiation factor 4E [Kluyveromyces marxianus DMKU3-1042]KAG0674095.1 eukaryotic translation initiation factor 4E [Kluyveromyces marxianus]KAG0681913.1 eukaryotic translation initiation factor 4E [Kluyveromyces marxianus]QGN17963.1 eukaryotic translation initiation factor 4E [Kluyveromyces marxianus]BAO42703.1 eukaryotic translation initiation factor 4E [Kluyveromyces marxianus DMKU3-1042]BAP74074.1 eukaryotic translation initiation factor 4E [Kluyveromyces marxianus]